VYRQLNKAAEMVDMPDGIGTHTMRKTFGYWFYKQTKDVAELQMILNHSHPNITLTYIGITEEEWKKAVLYRNNLCYQNFDTVNICL
jgi:integrase